LYSYVSTYPAFKPVDNGISYESQQQMYNFIADILHSFYEHPDILGIGNEPDGYYENWAMNNSNPALLKSMEKIESKFADNIDLLIKIGKLGEVSEHSLSITKDKWSITKLTKLKLESFGIVCEQSKEQTLLYISKYPLIFAAWKGYSNNDDTSASKISRVISFIYGKNSGRRYRVMDFFGGLIDNKEYLENLENYLEVNHFTYNNTDLAGKTRYAYVKWSKDYPKGEAASMRTTFDWRKKNQMIIEFRLPQFRIMLNSYNEMDADLQKLVFYRLKICDNCGYCTQTDKSGKRPCLALELSCDTITQNKCPLYPYLTWVYINGEELNTMLKLFQFAESKLLEKKDN
jgi:hypothetical protein